MHIQQCFKQFYWTLANGVYLYSKEHMKSVLHILLSIIKQNWNTMIQQIFTPIPHLVQSTLLNFCGNIFAEHKLLYLISTITYKICWTKVKWGFLALQYEKKCCVYFNSIYNWVMSFQAWFLFKIWYIWQIYKKKRQRKCLKQSQRGRDEVVSDIYVLDMSTN